MHIQFNPESYPVWLDYYNSQAQQAGYGLEGFKGIPYQRGAGLGSFFKSLFKMAVPVFRTLGKNLGKHALTAGANIATDLAEGKPLYETVRKRARQETGEFLNKASQALQQQEGEGLGFRPTSINIDNNDDIFNKTIKYGTYRPKIHSKHKK